MTTGQYVYRSRSARAMAIVVMALAALALVNVATSGWRMTLQWGLIPLWLAYTTWGLFWWPSVRMDQQGVKVVNVLRSVQVAWSAIQRIDTRWSLTLFTPRGKVTAFAAPSPSNFKALQARPADLKGLPESTYVAGSIRPGDLPHSPSGHAALVVRQRWEALRDADQLGTPEKADVVSRWHWKGLAVWLALSVAGFALVRWAG
ncbi:MAG: PH domain-containing protein [Micrococcales bacterium]|nr:PH domain-containing protein [Micrococcales bacterium]